MELRPYQRQAIAELTQAHGTGHSRATLVLPCGTGKTMVATQLIPTSPGSHTVVFLPTLALLSQTWRTLEQTCPTATLIGVCSQPRTIKDGNPLPDNPDDLPMHAAAKLIGAQLSTDPDTISEHLRSTADALIVLATYTSSPIVKTAAESAETTFDLLICDESHRTAGTDDKPWATPVHKIAAHRRLFMTATPRTVRIDENTDTLDDADVISMNSLADYGPHIAPIGFREAITARWLSDYTIAMVGVSARSAYNRLTRSAATSGHRPTHAATQIALLNAAKKYDLKSVLVFHNTIQNSKDWTNELQHTAAALHTPLYTEHLDGTTDPAARSHMLAKLHHPERLSVISNCKVFAEGIDVPDLDAVMFAAPRTSGPDIIQIVGRAIRPHSDPTKKAVIILPILDFNDDPADTDTKAARTSYLAAWQVLTALAEEDTLLHETLARWADHATYDAPQPDPALLDPDIDTLSSVAQHFTFKTIAKASSPHLITATRLRAFYNTYGHTNPRPNTTTTDGFPLATRLHAARGAYRDGRLHPRVAAAFDAIPGFAWKPGTSTRKRTPQQWIALVAHYITATGIRTIPRDAFITDPETGEKARLGTWLHNKARQPDYLTQNEKHQLRTTGYQLT